MKEPIRSPKSVPPGLALAARVAVGSVFVASGLYKASLPAQEFAAVVDAYQILRPETVLPFATLLPWIEILVGLALIAGYLTRAAAAAAAGLLLAFTGALSSTLIRRLPLENCGCFGGGVYLTPPQAMGLDACLLLLAFLILRCGRPSFALDAWIERGD